MTSIKEKIIYLFSGLGADKRVFKNLKIEGRHQFIEWLIPLPKENMAQYVDRLIKEQIDIQLDISIIGVSFGGIIGVEVAKKLGIKKIMIISSAKTYLEIPLVYRLIGKIGIDKLIPAQWLKWKNPLVHYFFGAKSNAEKILLGEILSDTNNLFLKWAIRQILEWRNEEIPQNLIHIHGTNDKILWFSCLQNIIPIQNGGHLMILDKSVEINALADIKNIFSNVQACRTI